MQLLNVSEFLFFFFLIFYFFRERGREREREGEKHQCVVASCTTAYWGPGLQPRHVLSLGIELAALWFTGQRSVHCATLARAESMF